MNITSQDTREEQVKTHPLFVNLAKANAINTLLKANRPGFHSADYQQERHEKLIVLASTLLHSILLVN